VGLVRPFGAGIAHLPDPATMELAGARSFPRSGHHLLAGVGPVAVVENIIWRAGQGRPQRAAFLEEEGARKILPHVAGRKGGIEAEDVGKMVPASRRCVRKAESR